MWRIRGRTLYASQRSFLYRDDFGSRRSSRRNVSASLYPTSKSDHRLPSHSSTTAVQIRADRRFFPRRTPK